MTQAATEDYARGMYARVNELWAEHGANIFEGACGFAILSGPPIFRPQLMIIGGNPGFNSQDCEPHIEKSWPHRSYIADANWTLARRLRAIFATESQGKILENAMQANFQFFKSSSIDRTSRYPWSSLDVALRTTLERCCFNELSGYVAISQPEIILILGLSSFDQHASVTRTVFKDQAERRRLMVEGKVFGRPAFGILHPSGAQVANDDWPRVASHIEKCLRTES